ncbi:LysR family transcriptional regulator [Enterobacteriaceae bacterium RIT697]|uniref:LysR family transcriptional regulator n=1 Tax=Pantoea endophytica TaxID=92488 RepID=UPI0012AE3796|nr:LysR family transcriptional regulator [Pantoea endophytica]MRT24958.1 LysR family transcriptional regulator [Enterobacteriaceae bacterium RIT697]
MLTIKQIQAFYWVSRLGTLSKAADKLHITQSAATKRLKEVEIAARVPLFENDGRKNRLTQKGKELVKESENILSLIDELDVLKGSSKLPARTLHVGLTELSAQTWFPDFIKLLKERYPSTTVRPEVESSINIYQMLKEGKLDFAFLPDLHADEGLAKVTIGSVPFAWFAAPGLYDGDRVYALKELSEQTVIEQNANSIITELCSQLWEIEGVQPTRIHGGNNINALAGLISAGMGISCLPRPMLQRDIELGKLHPINTFPVAPEVNYHCFFHRQLHSALGFTISDIARQAYSSATENL